MILNPTSIAFTGSGWRGGFDLTVEGTSGTPEPGTFLLLGCAGLATAVKRRQHKNAV